MQSRTIKITGILLLLVLALAVFAPKLIGMSVHELVINDTLELLPPEARAQLEVQENRFDAGWFRSEAALTLEYRAAGILPVEIQLDLHIQHGPLLFTRNGPALGLVYATLVPNLDNADIRAARAELPFALPATHIDLLAGLNGAVTLRLDVDGIDYREGQDLLQFEGLQSRFVAYRDQSAQFSLHVGALQAHETSSRFEFALAGLDLTSSTRRMNDLLAPSSATLSLPEFRSDSPYPLAVRGVRSESRLQAATTGPDQSHLSQHLHVDELASELPLTALDWVLHIDEIDNALLRSYLLLATELQNEINAGGMTEQASQTMGTMVLLMLQNRLVIDSEITATAYGGDHSADLQLRWAGQPQLTEIVRLDLKAALAALTLSLDLSLDLEAIMRSPLATYVDPYVQDGYLRLENGRIILQARLANSTMQVNDETMTLEQLF